MHAQLGNIEALSLKAASLGEDRLAHLLKSLGKAVRDRKATKGLLWSLELMADGDTPTRYGV